MLVDVRAEEVRVPLLVGDVEHRLQTVRRGLVGTEDAEVVGVQPDDVGEPLAEHARRLGDRRPGGDDVDGVVAEVGQAQVLEQQPAVGVRVGAHPQLALGRERGDVRVERAVLVEQFVGAVGLEPVRSTSRCSGVSRALASGTWCARHEPVVFLPSM